MMGLLGVPEEDADGGGVEVVDGVADLGAVGDDGEDVHFGLEFDEVAGLGVAFDEGHGAVGVDGDVHEEVEVGDDVAFAEAVFG